MPVHERLAMLAEAEELDLSLHTELVANGALIRDVYFPRGALCSHVMNTSTGESIEVALVGVDGMIPVAGILGETHAVGDVVVQSPGYALRLPADVFRERCRTQLGFARAADAYVTAYIGLIGLNAACNALHRLDQRLARWLLVATDLSRRNTFPFTHEYLAEMLGVRRASVTEIAQRLRNEGVLDYGKGSLIVVDRPGLEALACPCYQTIRELSSGIYLAA